MPAEFSSVVNYCLSYLFVCVRIFSGHIKLIAFSNMNVKLNAFGIFKSYIRASVGGG